MKYEVRQRRINKALSVYLETKSQSNVNSSGELNILAENLRATGYCLSFAIIDGIYSGFGGIKKWNKACKLLSKWASPNTPKLSLRAIVSIKEKSPFYGKTYDEVFENILNFVVSYQGFGNVEYTKNFFPSDISQSKLIKAPNKILSFVLKGKDGEKDQVKYLKNSCEIKKYFTKLELDEILDERISDKAICLVMTHNHALNIGYSQDEKTWWIKDPNKRRLIYADKQLFLKGLLDTCNKYNLKKKGYVSKRYDDLLSDNELTTLLELVFLRFDKYQPKTSYDYYRLALASDLAGNIKRALRFYNESVEKRPDSIYARHNLALLYMRKKQYTDALTHINNLIDHFPDSYRLLLLRASIAIQFRSRKPMKQAVIDLNKILSIKKDEPYAFFLFGQINVVYGKAYYNLALENYNKALLLSPKSFRYNVNKIKLLLKMGDNNSLYLAKSSLDNCLQMDLTDSQRRSVHELKKKLMTKIDSENISNLKCLDQKQHDSNSTMRPL